MSDRPPLTFSRLHVRRTPGVPSGFTLPELCAGLNIVYGPNASGKSTTARAIHSLLWPGAAPWPRASFAGTVQFDGAEWHVDFDAGSHRWQRDGVDCGGPGIVPLETRDRYILTLHDLLSADNSAFAEVVLRESVGGYDINQALDELGYRPKPIRPDRERQNVKRARTEAQRVRREQDDLRRQEGELAHLQERKERALEAEQRGRVLEKAIEYVTARESYEEAKARLAAFPEAMARLVGNEMEVLQDIKKSIARLAERRREHEQMITTALTDRRDSELEGITVPDELILTLRAKCQRLQDLASQVASLSRDVEAARAERAAARSRIGDALNEEQLAALDAAGLLRFAEFVREAEEVQAEQKAAEALQMWLGQVEVPSHLDDLRVGITLLHRRLRIPSTTDARVLRLVRLAALLTIIEAIVLVALVHWALAVLLLPGLGLLYISRGSSQADATMDRAKYLEDEFTKLDLGEPSTWEADEVEKFVDQLHAQLREAIVAEEKATRWADLQKRRDHLTARVNQLARQRADLSKHFGIEPSVASGDLYLLATNVAEWQKVDSRFQAALARREIAAQEHQSLLDTINRRLAPFGYPTAKDHAEALGAIENLAQRIDRFQVADRTIREARRMLDTTILPEIVGLDKRHADVFKQLDLKVNDEVMLSSLLSQLEEYRAAEEALREAEFSVRRLENELVGHEEFKEFAIERLESDYAQAKALSAELEDLSTRIGQIQGRIDDAKRKHDLEAALAVEQESLGALREARAEATALVAGWTLGEFIRQQTRDRERPEVFHRARELFSRITHGRYRLEFDDAVPPTFRATDMTTGAGQSLDELSSATRVQLLMAVRLAFVEAVEQGPKLPLLLDETLGNSDEQRTRAIVDATVEICRDGRQIFYFTAQHDEVEKWIEILEQAPNLPLQIINLAEVRGLVEIESAPTLVAGPAPRPGVPAPNGLSHSEYGKTLNVPEIDPWSADIGGTHLWYLIPDPGDLYRLLLAGVSTWGQLQNLAEYGNGAVVERNRQLYQRAEVRARALQIIIDGWRVGRGRRIDRLILLDSGAVSETFIDDVSALAETRDGDPKALLTALEEGGVKRFRRRSVEQLRDYLIDHQYVDMAEPLSLDTLRKRIRKAFTAELAEGCITRDDIEDLLAVVYGAAGVTVA